MDKTYILAIDQGTTSSRAMIFDRQGKIVSTAQQEIPQYYPKPGWVEHDANEIWVSVLGVMAASMSRANILPEQIVAIGITDNVSMQVGKKLFRQRCYSNRTNT